MMSSSNTLDIFFSLTLPLALSVSLSFSLPLTSPSIPPFTVDKGPDCVGNHRTHMVWREWGILEEDRTQQGSLKTTTPQAHQGRRQGRWRAENMENGKIEGKTQNSTNQRLYFKHSSVSVRLEKRVTVKCWTFQSVDPEIWLLCVDLLFCTICTLL